MAKVIGQDIPSKHYDTYGNLLTKAYDQTHQKNGSTVKKGSWNFPGYPFHPRFPSPGQLYVRAIFKSATVCWHLQPTAGGSVKPDTGPRPREWWELEADKDRTFGYRKFMRDTLLHKFRIGEPTWCVPYLVPATFTDYDFPDENFCDSWNLFATYSYYAHYQYTFCQKPPEDLHKEFLYLYAWDVKSQGPKVAFVRAVVPNWFVFVPCALTWNTMPRFDITTCMHEITGDGWFRFYVGPYMQTMINIYFKWFDFMDPDFKGGLVFHGPNSPDVDKRPFYAYD